MLPSTAQQIEQQQIEQQRIVQQIAQHLAPPVMQPAPSPHAWDFQKDYTYPNTLNDIKDRIEVIFKSFLLNLIITAPIIAGIGALANLSIIPLFAKLGLAASIVKASTPSIGIYACFHSVCNYNNNMVLW